MKAPNLFGAGLPAAVFVEAVRNGAAGMPPFHPSALSDADLAALMTWIGRQPADPSAVKVPR